MPNKNNYTGNVGAPKLAIQYVAMSEIEQTTALQTVVTEIERGTSRLGWDQPAALYALVRTKDLLQAPDLPPDIAEQLRESWDGSPDHLSAILQDSPGEDELEGILPQLAWPESVAGAAASVERIVLPTAVEDQIPADPEEAEKFVANHPARNDVRLTVGALRDGETWCALRTRTFDADDQVATGADLVPALTQALRAGFAPESETGQ